MKVIINPISSAESICGKQKIIPNEKYRLSRHCMEVDCADGKLIYNTLTGSICLIEKDKDSDALRDDLIEMWYLVPDNFDENTFADDMRYVASLIKPKSKHKDHFTILTTTDCNARCRYCYELGRKRITMTCETAQAVANYMIHQSGGNRPLKLFWFGGEPLFNIPAIETITEILRERGISYRSNMTSNGFYLTPDVLKRAKEDWHLESVQITIDGTEKVYNKIKAYTDDCENPYEQVLNNIENALLSGIRVLIRLNMDSKNSEEISDVIDELCSRFNGIGDCKIYVAMLRSYKSKVAEFESDQEKLNCFYCLRDKIKRYGMLRSTPLTREIKLNRCKADNDACEIILPDGQLDRCHHYTEGEQIGSIFSEVRDQKMIDSWKEIKKDYPECKNCAMYPLCLNLKKCDNNGNDCSFVDREILRQNLEEKVLNQYIKWKSEKA